MITKDRLALYLVTDPSAHLGVVETARLAVLGGATLVQLRDKSASDAEMIKTGRALKAMLDPLGVPLVVNDRISVALEIGAAGLHVGQSDMEAIEARRAVGEQAILGLSVEMVAQLSEVPWDAIDYIGAGPIHGTATKSDHAAPIGYDGLEQIVALSPKPVVAIGGLSAKDARPVRKAGAAGLAVVSAITGAKNPRQAAADLVTAWRSE